MDRFAETLYDAYGQEFSVDEVYYERKTEHQHLIIFENSFFGRVMALDGIIQTTERDEFIYHEMMVHVPMFSADNAKEILIIGGGDGGALREVCKHNCVTSVTQVEIDAEVIDMCRQYLPKHSSGAYEDPRTNIIISDGLEFVTTSEQRFDIIICDSTDPIGPGESLFSSDFYHHCFRCLNPGGILVAQNGVAFFQLDEVCTTAQRLAPLFNDVRFYCAAVPSYIGGVMTFAWACNNATLWQRPEATIHARFEKAAIKTRYYNPAIHCASFALPQYIHDAINIKQ